MEGFPPSSRAKSRAVSVVLSVEPSDIIRISQPLGSWIVELSFFLISLSFQNPV